MAEANYTVDDIRHIKQLIGDHHLAAPGDISLGIKTNPPKLKINSDSQQKVDEFIANIEDLPPDHPVKEFINVKGDLPIHPWIGNIAPAKEFKIRSTSSISSLRPIG